MKQPRHPLPVQRIECGVRIISDEAIEPEDLDLAPPVDAARIFRRNIHRQPMDTIGVPTTENIDEITELAARAIIKSSYVRDVAIVDVAQATVSDSAEACAERRLKSFSKNCGVVLILLEEQSAVTVDTERTARLRETVAQLEMPAARIAYEAVPVATPLAVL